MNTRTLISALQVFLWTALVLALASSVSNLAWSFGSVHAGDLVLGYIAAGAVDVGLFTMALAMQVMAERKQPVGWLRFGTLLFGAVSVYGNLAYGYAHAAAIAAPYWIDVSRPAILAAVAPALVFVLSEVAGHTVRSYAAPAKRPETHAESTETHVAPQLAYTERTANDDATHMQTGTPDAHGTNGKYPKACPYCGELQETPQGYATHTGRWCKMRPATVLAGAE